MKQLTRVVTQKPPTVSSKRGRSPSRNPAEAAKPAGESAEVQRAAAEFPIIGIGASAGGLEALELFLKHVPVSSGMGYVIVQHLDPTRKGMLPELLGRCTTMPVVQVKDLTTVLPDCVYVIPPNKDLSILHGVLHLLEPFTPRGLRLPVDYFFRALAEDQHEFSVGVILSGMGTDGTLGLRAIKEKAGLCVVQDCSEAKFDSMPRSAIAAGLADLVATAGDMPQKIMAVLRHARVSVALVSERNPQGHSDFDKIVILLRGHNGHDFSLYKKSSVYRRIERRMSIHQFDRIGLYVRYLRENPAELDLLFKELLIGVTSFFRDSAAWKRLQERELPALLAARPDGGSLRAWVPACSTGEEAYTLAITFAEAVRQADLSARYALQIFATDLDRDSIEKARQGLYPPNIAADVGGERLKRYFVEQEDGYRIGGAIREMVTFAPQDVLLDPPFTRLDLLSCRNLLIYLAAEPQKKLISLFYYSLNPGGILLLGSAETVGSASDLFEALDPKTRLYQRLNRLGDRAELDFPTGRKPIVPNPHPVVGKPGMPASLQTFAERFLLQALTPAAVLTNGKGDILYVSGRTGKYLEPATGGANWNIYVMARDGLDDALAGAVRRAVNKKGTVTVDGLKVKTDGGQQRFNLRVQSIQQPVELRDMLMVSFTEVAAAAAKKRGKAQSESVDTTLVTELEEALRAARTENARLREDMQTAQEELRSANEELQSTNEELQSTNEELTTSKEEMQSMNEELQTVNAELQAKLVDLLHASSDMKNLLDSTDIATIFLDGVLHIRRFTHSATHVFKLILGDVGRPLSDIVSDLQYPDLLRDAQDVLQTLMYSEKLIQSRGAQWFKVRIMPYRTLENAIDGVVITAVNITNYQQLWSVLPKQDG